VLSKIANKTVIVDVYDVDADDDEDEMHTPKKLVRPLRLQIRRGRNK
jgi:hypothetical protein